MCIIPDLAGDEEFVPVPFTDEGRKALPNDFFIAVKWRTVYVPIARSYCRPVQGDNKDDYNGPVLSKFVLHKDHESACERA